MDQTSNTHGRPYLRLADAKQGDFIELDSGFTCRKAGKAILFANIKGECYFSCADGSHYISGQADDGIHCVGIYPTQQYIRA